MTGDPLDKSTMKSIYHIIGANFIGVDLFSVSTNPSQIFLGY